MGRWPPRGDSAPAMRAVRERRAEIRMSNTATGDSKYQTLTPVPPIPPVSAVPAYGAPHVYGAQHSFTAIPYHASYLATGGAAVQSAHPIGFLGPDGGKALKLGIAEPDSSTPESHPPVENSFQVPSVSSTTTRPANGAQSVPQHGAHLNVYHSDHFPGPPALPPSPHHMQMQQPPVQDTWEQTKSVVMPLGGQSAVPNAAENANNEKVTKKKRKRCGECPGCLKKDNCGECGPCKSVRSHQICKMRKCDQLKTKKEKVREVSVPTLYTVWRPILRSAVPTGACLRPRCSDNDARPLLASGSGRRLLLAQGKDGTTSVDGPGTGPRQTPVALNGSSGRVFVGEPSGGGVGPRVSGLTSSSFQFTPHIKVNGTRLLDPEKREVLYSNNC
ncbi:uncharacterized protein B4U79_04650 [Dinothrombium tinctorium]|uniref:CXXC-type domain-containing protein n=1 Tax=Dinothrombium tinctorium TaxID=1965070 RepID=A0A443R3H4_9ACAR|nr:uncharacterized protein B4U79_04650 [Dinothrombium tinctorium]